jgi:hypothetical protein
MKDEISSLQVLMKNPTWQLMTSCTRAVRTRAVRTRKLQPHFLPMILKWRAALPLVPKCYDLHYFIFLLFWNGDALKDISSIVSRFEKQQRYNWNKMILYPNATTHYLLLAITAYNTTSPHLHRELQAQQIVAYSL